MGSTPLEYRAQFGSAEGVCYQIDGAPATAEQFSLRTMNFGQLWRTPGLTETTYRVILPLDFIVAYLAEEMLPDLYADAQRFPEDDSDLEVVLRARGWPDARRVFDDPQSADLALDFFDHELLLRWLGDGAPQAAPGVVLNTIERVAFENGAALFEGTGRHAQQDVPVRYQDV